MNELTINLKSGSDKPMYEQIYDYIKNEIISGKMYVQYKLPSTRALSKHLDISRSTVEMAYEQLLSEGYIEAVPCKGYYVAATNSLLSYKKSEIKKKDREDNLKDSKKYDIDFSPRGIDLESFPYNAWRKVTKNILIDDNKELFNAGDRQGDYEFRSTICNYLYQARGAVCEPERVIVGAGNEYLLMLLNQIIDENSIIAMEDPTYKQAYRIFRSMGRCVEPVMLDRYGIDISKLEKTNASIAYVTPSHQFPLGIVMPVHRRNELLAWAELMEDRYIIEDDYDSEFRYKGKPIPSLFGSDTKDKVIYIGTFSRSIAPAIRMSYMVLPESLFARYKERISFYSSSVPRIDQKIVNAFINEGYYERHLNKMRATYKNKKETLVNAIKKYGKCSRISGDEAGIHILVEIDNGLSEKELVERAKIAGVRVYPLSDYYIDINDLTGRPTILIGYAVIGVEEIEDGIKRIADIL